ncbi:integrase core domain protein [Lasius niger]|uniref:Integrase core domain protein n=1 Tax=Lasius niger TaxID=67767 RepID=A0A0J7K0J6_LASNI|nr:integrase core domain protein [Lasius niger]
MESDEWLDAMADEMVSIIKNDTWCLVDRTEEMDIIGSRMVLRNKFGADAARHNYTVNQLDVATDYLNGELEEIIYIRPPKGLEEILGFLVKNNRYGVDIRNKAQLMLQQIKEVKNMGVANFCLGMEFKRCQGKISINQGRYVLELLERFGMTNAKPVSTPLVNGVALSEPDGKQSEEDAKLPFRELVGALNYLAMGTRPDISFAVSYLGQLFWQRSLDSSEEGA